MGKVSLYVRKAFYVFIFLQYQPQLRNYFSVPILHMNH